MIVIRIYDKTLEEGEITDISVQTLQILFCVERFHKKTFFSFSFFLIIYFLIYPSEKFAQVWYVYMTAIKSKQ